MRISNILSRLVGERFVLSTVVLIALGCVQAPPPVSAPRVTDLNHTYVLVTDAPEPAADCELVSKFEGWVGPYTRTDIRRLPTDVDTCGLQVCTLFRVYVIHEFWQRKDGRPDPIHCPDKMTLVKTEDLGSVSQCVGDRCEPLSRRANNRAQ
jgi:hypothetical protein